jgi:hypothetical protein
MKKNLINEVSRIQQIMGKSIISEQAAVPKLLKNIAVLGDDVIKKIFKTFDSDVDNAVNAIKRGDTVSDEIIQKIAKNLDFNAISKIIFDNKLLGPAFDSKIDESILFIKNNPDSYDSVIQQFDDTIDRLTYLRGSPPELIQSLKNELKSIINNGIESVSALSKYFKTGDEVVNYVANSLNVTDISKLRQIKGVNPKLVEAANKLVGKTIDESQKELKKVIDEIQYNPDFQKFYETYFDTSKDVFISKLKKVADYLFVADKRKYVFVGDKIINPATGKVETDFAMSGLKTANSMLAINFLWNLFKNYLSEGQTAGEATANAFNDSYASILGTAFGLVLKSVGEHRAEMGDLTIDEVMAEFTPTAKSLNKPIENYDFEKLSRGVWKVVDVDSENPTDYLVIKRSGEITIVPFSEGQNINWSSDISQWLKGIKEKYKTNLE